MHRCLLIPEIRRLIVAQIPSVEREYPPGPIVGDGPDEVPAKDRRTYASLARTCRALYDPAMDALWMDITGTTLRPILTRLLIATGTSSTLLPAKSPFDPFARFLRNAARVQELQLFVLMDTVDQLRALKLRIPRVVTLFPCLKRLFISDLSVQLAVFLPWFITPTLTTLGTRMCPDINALTATLAQLAQTAPRLQSIIHLHGTCPAVSPLYLMFDHLTSFRCDDGITGELLLHLSRIRSLRVLRLGMSPDLSTQPWGDSAFPALADLGVGSAGVIRTLNIVRLVTSPHLVKLKIYFDTLQKLSLNIMHNLLESVKVHPWLQSLHIKCSDACSYAGEPVPISTLYPLRALRSLTLALPGICITDEDIPALAQAWPDLDTFFMRRHSFDSLLGSALFTPDALDLFAHHLPRLRRLGIDLDTSDLEEYALPERRSLAPITLYLDHNPLDDFEVPTMAALISAAYPRAVLDLDVYKSQALARQIAVAAQLGDDVEAVSDAWKRIKEDLLPLLSRFREHELRRAAELTDGSIRAAAAYV